MRHPRAFAAAAVALALAFRASGQPISLHPDNGHYFLFRGEPAVLVTSGEHYGALLNLDFDYVPYFQELGSHGLNLTRTFSGTYVETAGFIGPGNPLAPTSHDKYICPWARSSTPGAADGGNKFDLSTWDAAYFARLKDFVAEAGKQGVVVEYVFFCPFYNDGLWDVNPMKSSNNVNGVGNIGRTSVYTLSNDGLLAYQEAFVRKVCAELESYDSLYYEVCNEPYFGGVQRPEWEDLIIATIVDAESSFQYKHLIAQNIANGSKKITGPNPAVSVFNFHYADPPNCVGENYGLNKVTGDDETGFDGTADLAYRTEGWNFVIAGGGVYDNLDYSFTPDAEDGSAALQHNKGGGGESLRTQLSILKDFIHGFDFVKMAPDNSAISGGVPGGASARALVEAGKAYAVYIEGGSQADLRLDLPAGSYAADWVNTKTGAIDGTESFDHAGGEKTLSSPSYSEDVALRVLAAGALAATRDDVDAKIRDRRAAPGSVDDQAVRDLVKSYREQQ
jgi:hypothetical protein